MWYAAFIMWTNMDFPLGGITALPSTPNEWHRAGQALSQFSLQMRVSGTCGDETRSVTRAVAWVWDRAGKMIRWADASLHFFWDQEAECGAIWTRCQPRLLQMKCPFGCWRSTNCASKAVKYFGAYSFWGRGERWASFHEESREIWLEFNIFLFFFLKKQD
jgi:hypothetical protein